MDELASLLIRDLRCSGTGATHSRETVEIQGTCDKVIS